jgi:hypothetical protein
MSDPTEEFLWKVHGYTSEFIRFADTKAALVVAWSSTLISGLFGLKAHRLLSPHRFTTDAIDVCTTVGGVAAAVAFSSLVVAFLIAMTIIMPRLWTKRKIGLIFWENIQGYKSAEQFLAALAQEQGFVNAIADHVFMVSAVCQRKYRRLKLAIGLSLVGGLAGVVVALSLS